MTTTASPSFGMTTTKVCFPGQGSFMQYDLDIVSERPFLYGFLHSINVQIDSDPPTHLLLWTWHLKPFTITLSSNLKDVLKAYIHMENAIYMHMHKSRSEIARSKCKSKSLGEIFQVTNSNKPSSLTHPTTHPSPNQKLCTEKWMLPNKI